MLMFWTLKLSFSEDILSFLNSATVLATLSKNWANYLSNHLVALCQQDFFRKLINKLTGEAFLIKKISYCLTQGLYRKTFFHRKKHGLVVNELVTGGH